MLENLTQRAQRSRVSSLYGLRVSVVTSSLSILPASHRPEFADKATQFNKLKREKLKYHDESVLKFRTLSLVSVLNFRTKITLFVLKKDIRIFLYFFILTLNG